MRQLPRRELRGLGLVAQGAQVRRVTDAHFIVNSSSGSGSYEVAWNGCRWTCQCGDFMTTGGPCKHAHALNWSCVLPLVTLANASVAGGIVGEDHDPRLAWAGRSVPVHDLVEIYRAALLKLREIDGVRRIRPPPPRLTVTRYASTQG
jgi:hypothetical protein